MRLGVGQQQPADDSRHVARLSDRTLGLLVWVELKKQPLLLPWVSRPAGTVALVTEAHVRETVIQAERIAAGVATVLHNEGGRPHGHGAVATALGVIKECQAFAERWRDRRPRVGEFTRDAQQLKALLDNVALTAAAGAGLV